MTNTDNEKLNALMLQASAGDEAAFRRFYDLVAPYLLAFLLRMMRDRYEAEDVLQESMVVAWNRASDYDPGIATAKTWITTIARRRALDILRRRKRRDEVLRDDAADIRLVFGDGDVSDPDTESTATANRLVHCFGEIGSDAATCIQYAYIQGLTFSEIADQVDRSIGTVKSWVQRGLGKLKKCMQR